MQFFKKILVTRCTFPPQVYLENDKSLLGAEGLHYYNIFFESVGVAELR